MIRQVYIPLALCFIMAPLTSAQAVIINQLTDIGDFTSTTILTNDFEDLSTDFGPVTFDATVSNFDAERSTGGVTSSGTRVLIEDRDDTPLGAVFSVDVFEVGFYFGNDAVASFDVVLEVFDSTLTSLGSVSMTVNGNDFADQFIGLRSDTAIRSIAFSHLPPGEFLSFAIDDFTIGFNAAVPAPGTLALVVLGLAGIGFARNKEQG